MVELWVDADNGNDANPGTQDKPLRTPSVALSKVGGSHDLVHTKGIFYQGIKFNQTKYPGHVTVDGHNKTLVYGFDGPFQEFDPANPPPRTYGNLVIMDAHNVTIKNMDIWGGNSCAISLDDSYPNVGLRNIHLEGVKVRYGEARGIFMGGNNIEGIFIDGCSVTETCYGDTTHNIYLSGGHWNGDYPPIRKIRIRNTECKYSGGRHGIQLNGRFDDVVIHGNKLYHNELAGLSLIGCQNVSVMENEIYGNNRQGIVIYDYWDDHYFDIENPESIEAWKACHHPNDRIMIRNNTILTGPTQWHRDPWRDNKPYKKACVLINNTIPELGIPYKQQYIVIRDNVIWSPWANLIRFGHLAEAHATYAYYNMLWTTQEWFKPVIDLPYGQVWYDIEWLEKNCSKWYKDNMIMDPKFVKIPEYELIDRCVVPGFNFKDHKTSADLFSEVAAKNNKGRTYKRDQTKEGNYEVNPFDGATPKEL